VRAWDGPAAEAPPGKRDRHRSGRSTVRRKFISVMLGVFVKGINPVVVTLFSGSG
jgi:hypothetical protein